MWRVRDRQSRPSLGPPFSSGGKVSRASGANDFGDEVVTPPVRCLASVDPGENNFGDVVCGSPPAWRPTHAGTNDSVFVMASGKEDSNLEMWPTLNVRGSFGHFCVLEDGIDGVRSGAAASAVENKSDDHGRSGHLCVFVDGIEGARASTAATAGDTGESI